MRTLALSLALCALASTARADTSFQIENNRLVVPGVVLFQTGTDKILPESEKVLDHVRGYLAAKSYITLLRVEGHTESQGGAEHNQALSEKRAMAVARALVAKGVDCKRLLPVGFGETKPVAANTTAEGRAANRRVEFVNAALRGRPIGGMPVDGGGRVAGDACR